MLSLLQIKLYGMRMLSDKAGDPATSPGGASAPKVDPPAPGSSFTMTKEQFDAIMARIPAATPPPGTPPTKPDDPSLSEKARKEREEQEKQAGDTKRLEKALSFTMGAEAWLKTNASLLPNSIAGIFAAANKENYANAMEKESALKVEIVNEFFQVQANLDLLTPTLKSQLEDFQKLTKNGKQEKAQTIYDSVFEPAFEMHRRLKKAEQLNKGHGNSSEEIDAYKNKLVAGSRKHYLGENKNA